MPRETVRTTWNEVEIRKKFSEETDWRKKIEQSEGQSFRLELNNSLFMMSQMKKIVAWLSTSSRVSWLQVWKQMHSWLSLPMSTCWRWEATSARGREKKVLKDKLLFWGKKSPRLCISRLRSNEFYSTESWRIGIERFGGTHHEIPRTHLAQDRIRERKKANLEALSKKANLMSEILARPVRRNNHLRKLATSRLYQQSSVEFGEKIRKLKPKTTTIHSPVKAPETRKIVCLLWIRELQCTMPEQGELSSDTLDTLRRSKTPHATNRDQVAVQINEYAPVFVHDLDLFATVQLLDKTQALLVLHQLCLMRGCSCEWKTATLHKWPKLGRQILLQWTTQYFSLYQDWHHIPAAFCLQHRDQRISLIIPEYWEHY